MDDFPSNARQSKIIVQKTTQVTTESAKEPEETKKVERVVTSEVIRRKKPLGKRMFETFFGSDAKTVVHFVLMEVLIPAAKDMVADAVSQGVERTLFGEVRSTSRRGSGSRSILGSPGYVSYNRMGSPGVRREEPARELSRRARSNHEFDEIIIATRVEADEVIDRLFDLISKYGHATVADLYDMLEITGAYTDDKWGWTDLRGARSERVRQGYLLDLPRPEPLR